MKKTTKKQDFPKIIALPPLIFLIGLIIGLLIHVIIPISFFLESIKISVGIILIALGIMVMFYSMAAFGKAKTEIDPRKPTTKIVDFGPYKYSRNPIYLSMASIYSGITIWVNSLWMLLVLVLVLITVHFGVIKKEEEYLEGKFGKKYSGYKKKVRRWI